MRGKTNHARERRLRRDQTEAERVLWQHVRDRRLLGWKFRRQRRVGPYFADFTCTEGHLIVELDGSQHLDAVEHDAARTRFLETRGFRVLRFWNDDVLRETDAVLDAIAAALAPQTPTRRPLPPGGGQGSGPASRPGAGAIAPHPPSGHLLPACGEKGKHGPACGEKRAAFSASAPRGRSGRRSG